MTTSFCTTGATVTPEPTSSDEVDLHWEPRNKRKRDDKCEAKRSLSVKGDDDGNLPAYQDFSDEEEREEGDVAYGRKGTDDFVTQPKNINSLKETTRFDVQYLKLLQLIYDEGRQQNNTKGRNTTLMDIPDLKMKFRSDENLLPLSTLTAARPPCCRSGSCLVSTR